MKHFRRVAGIALVACVISSAKGEEVMSLPPVDSFWNYSDPQASETNFRHAVDEAHHAGDIVYELNAATQLARSLGLQQKFDESQAVLDSIKARVNAEMTLVQTRWHLEQGRLLNSSGHSGESISHFKSALAMAETNHYDYLAIDAAHMLGIVEEPAVAIRWNETAISMTEATTDQDSKHWLGPLRNNLGWTYFDMGEYNKALDLFSKDYDFRMSRNAPFQASIALWSKAKTLRMLGQVEEALTIQETLADNPLRAGKPAEGYTHEEIGECLVLLDRAEEAKGHFAIAYERLKDDPWLQADESERLERILQLSK